MSPSIGIADDQLSQTQALFLIQPSHDLYFMVKNEAGREIPSLPEEISPQTFHERILPSLLSAKGVFLLAS